MRGSIQDVCTILTISLPTMLPSRASGCCCCGEEDWRERLGVWRRSTRSSSVGHSQRRPSTVHLWQAGRASSHFFFRFLPVGTDVCVSEERQKRAVGACNGYASTTYKFDTRSLCAISEVDYSYPCPSKPSGLRRLPMLDGCRAEGNSTMQGVGEFERKVGKTRSERWGAVWFLHK